MDMRTLALLTDLAGADEPTRARAGLGAAQGAAQAAAFGRAWRAVAGLALTVLLGAALAAAPLVVWAVWLRGR